MFAGLNWRGFFGNVLHCHYFKLKTMTKLSFLCQQSKTYSMKESVSNLPLTDSLLSSVIANKIIVTKNLRGDECHSILSSIISFLNKGLFFTAFTLVFNKNVTVCFFKSFLFFKRLSSSYEVSCRSSVFYFLMIYLLFLCMFVFCFYVYWCVY